MTEFLHISYVSRPSKPSSMDEILHDIGRFRERNLSLGLTGCLAFQDDRIMQVIEGERTACERMFETLCRDARHVDVVPLERKPIDCMSFQHWGMIRRPIADVLFLTQLT